MPPIAPPIAIFAYNRPLHLAKMLSSLKLNERSSLSDLYVFSDFAKSELDLPKVKAVREFVKNLKDFKSVTLIERTENFGLARSIIEGVTQLVEAHDQVIVLEDDLELSPYFLDYMHQGLSLYRDVEQVASIHGYTLPLKINLPETFFLRGADCWGWATWKRAWTHFEPDGQKLLNELNSLNLAYQFDLDGTAGYLNMLRDQIAGRNNSWAIRWHASAYLKGLYTLYPSKSLVRNIGFDSSGTHCKGGGDLFEPMLADRSIRVNLQPICEHQMIRDAVKSFHRSASPSFAKRLFRKLKKIMSQEA